MHALDVLGDPVRRRILELLADGELAAGAISAVVQEEFGLTQPGVSQHLRVLRENGYVTVRPEGTRRLYSLDATPLAELDAWLAEETKELKLNLHPRAPYSINTLPVPEHGVRLLIGPEGGLSSDEIARTVQEDFKEMLLGPRVLRADTAAVAAITLWQAALGDWRA